MTLNSYLPKAFRRYAIAGLAIASITPLAAFAGEVLVAGGSGFETATSPLGLAAIAAPIAVTGLVAGLERRHNRLARRFKKERARAAQLRQAAYHDSLTGLGNRHALTESVDRILAGKSDRPGGLTLLLMDLDRFKYINDTLGHAAGDAVLKTLAGRLREHCSADHRVYRLGGDEFVVLWEGSQPQDAIAAYCEDLAVTVFRPVSHGSGTIETAGSIGIAISDGKGAVLSDILKRADLALYRAKSRPGTNHCFFSQDMDTDYRQRRELESAMREAVAEDAFRLDYLPVIKAGTLTPSGFKARLCWTRPGYGDVPQNVFMPMAEGSGLIVLIGKWMLRQALGDACSWHDNAEITLPVSALQFQDSGFASMVLTALKDARLAPGRLVLDVHAKSSIGECPVALANLEVLRAGGVQIAVSELAASVAGLSTARLFPVDRVRLDLGKIKSIAGEKRMAEMLNLFLQLASTVGTPVTLTGVDTEHDLKIACAAEPAEVQGDFAGTALSAGQALEFFTSMEGLARLRPDNHNTPDNKSLLKAC
ncbi:MAG: diguanylate cyclase [Hoeflea sp.]|uniref:putative bifunctional diguanylate cyclase/phosphodiesterase n=1 Tax=Hoeflea sp. TaxID=1940281 RepID=UPI003299A552